jgi:hypothetical protein
MTSGRTLAIVSCTASRSVMSSGALPERSEAMTSCRRRAVGDEVRAGESVRAGDERLHAATRAVARS